MSLAAAPPGEGAGTALDAGDAALGALGKRRHPQADDSAGARLVERTADAGAEPALREGRAPKASKILDSRSAGEGGHAALGPSALDAQSCAGPGESVPALPRGLFGHERPAALAGSDPREMAANQADWGSEPFRSSDQNMVENIVANEFRKAGTTSPPGARTPGGKTTPCTAASPPATEGGRGGQSVGLRWGASRATVASAAEPAGASSRQGAVPKKPAATARRHGAQSWATQTGARRRVHFRDSVFVCVYNQDSYAYHDEASPEDTDSAGSDDSSDSLRARLWGAVKYLMWQGPRGQAPPPRPPSSRSKFSDAIIDLPPCTYKKGKKGRKKQPVVVTAYSGVSANIMAGGMHEGSYTGPSPEGGGSKADVLHLRFHEMPAVLRQGPWKPTCLAFILLYGASLVHAAPASLAAFPRHSRALPWQEQLVAVGALMWMAHVMRYMSREFGPYPVVCLSVVTWMMMMLRLFCFLTAPSSAVMRVIGEIVHAPCIVNSAILFTGWWGVVFPAALVTMKDAAERRFFLRFNVSFFLTQMHIVSTVIAYGIYLAGGRKFGEFDLLTSSALGYAYMFFFQTAVGQLFFFPSYFWDETISMLLIVSPRLHGSVVTYSVLAWAAQAVCTALSHLPVLFFWRLLF